jgi:hypothetical protein
MLADCAEPLHHDARTLEIETDESSGHVDTSRDAKAGGADFIEWDAADGAGKADRAASLVLDPAHAELIGAHIGPGHVVANVADRAGEGSNEVFFVGGRHAGIGGYHRLAAAVAQAGRRILPSHGAGKPETFLHGHVRGHPHAADRGAACGVVDDDDRSQTDRWPVDVNDARRTESANRNVSSIMRPSISLVSRGRP